ncbi:hypothetical protein OFM15_30090, partial [Escherichia coli]|nr:hypothetical protein [Escherichia coli]
FFHTRLVFISQELLESAFLEGFLLKAQKAAEDIFSQLPPFFVQFSKSLSKMHKSSCNFLSNSL